MASNISDIKAAVHKRKTAASVAGSSVIAQGTPPDVPDSAFVRNCINAGELGLGMLLAALLRHKYIYIPNWDQWLVWDKTHWRLDELNELCADVELVLTQAIQDEICNLASEQAGADEDEAEKLSAIIKRAYRCIKHLRNVAGRNNAVTMARSCPSSLAVSANYLDLKPTLLACANAVIDLETGRAKDARRDYYLTMASPVEWRGIDAPAPAFDKFIHEIYNGDEELVEYIQRMFGYAASGLCLEQFFPILWGKGRNGKGTLINIIKHVMGPMASAVQSEMLLDQFGKRSSAGPSGDIKALKGLRMAFGSELDAGKRLSQARIKWLTGDDELVARAPYDKIETRWKPTHTLFLLTNPKPNILGGDYGFAKRLHFIPHRLSFVYDEPKQAFERKAVKGLGESIIREEASGVLAWLVRGFMDWVKKGGLMPPDSVTSATQDYLLSEDVIGQFIDDCLIDDPSAWEPATDVYNAFVSWYVKNCGEEKDVLSQHKFGKIFSDRYERKKVGSYRYIGIRLKYSILD